MPMPPLANVARRRPASRHASRQARRQARRLEAGEVQDGSRTQATQLVVVIMESVRLATWLASRRSATGASR